jgi:quinol monooxygenase YgiN
MAYGYIGSMRTQPGKRDDVVEILLSGTEGLRKLGCRSYVVGLAADDPATIVVT